jgi:hypothetical protein
MVLDFFFFEPLFASVACLTCQMNKFYSSYLKSRDRGIPDHCFKVNHYAGDVCTPFFFSFSFLTVLNSSK